MRYYGDFDSGMINESIGERENRLGRRLSREEATERLTRKGGWNNTVEPEYLDSVLLNMGYFADMANVVHFPRRKA